MRLILASTSPYRRELLARFRIAFDVMAPEVSEDTLPGESAAQTALRLARLKAESVFSRYPQAIVIGSDQTASIDGRTTLGKPGTADRAREQLRAASGRTAVFQTAVCVLAPQVEPQCACVATEVVFRTLTEAEIDRYVTLDQPLDCAGSARSEGLGITLLDALSGPDPTALIGLPLIGLSHMLRRLGLKLP